MKQGRDRRVIARLGRLSCGASRVRLHLSRRRCEHSTPLLRPQVHGRAQCPGNAESHSAACAPTQPEPSHQPASQPSQSPLRTPAPSAALCAHHNTPRPPPAPRPHWLEVRASAHCALSDARRRSIRVRCRRRRRAGGAGRRVAPRRVPHARVATVSTTSPRFHIARGRVGRPAHTPPALIDAEGDHQDDEGTHISTSARIYAFPHLGAAVCALSGAD